MDITLQINAIYYATAVKNLQLFWWKLVTEVTSVVIRRYYIGISTVKPNAQKCFHYIFP